MSKAPRAPGMTLWENPLGKPTAKLKLYLRPPVITPNPGGPQFPGTVQDSGFFEAEILPGESIYVPTELDNAIQKKDSEGVVQSGACPWLIRNGERPVLHESLDPVEQQRLQAEIDAEKARIKAGEAEAERLKAEQLRADAERIQRETADRASADQAARDKLASDQAELTKLLEDARKAKTEAERLKAEQEKKLEELAKPAAAESSGTGGDAGTGGGKRGSGKGSA
jgi:hypothetical protein